MSKKSEVSFVEVVSIIGAILIFCGVLWNIADNWHNFPSFLKIAILAIGTSASLIIGTNLKQKDYEKTGRAIVLLGGLLYIASVFLIAQIFFTSSSLQGTAWLFLISLLGIVAISYLLQSKENIFASFITFLLWFTIQFFAFTEKYDDFSGGLLALGFLIIGITFYALALIHKNNNHEFASLYKLWSVFYFLAIAYILSFQSLISILWEETIHLDAFTYFILTLAVISLSSLIYAISTATAKGNITKKEIIGFLITVLAFTTLIAITAITTNSVGTCYEKNCYDFTTKEECTNNIKECVWHEDNYCSETECYKIQSESICNEKQNCKWNNENEFQLCEYNYKYEEKTDVCNVYNNNKESCKANENECNWNTYISNSRDLPFSAWAIWIIINIVFILFILTIIGYGQLQKNSHIINLGIGFFILDIFTRYIGFIIDFYDYTGLSLTFIIGGILLLIGSWMGTKWRAKLINEKKKK